MVFHKSRVFRGPREVSSNGQSIPGVPSGWSIASTAAPDGTPVPPVTTFDMPLDQAVYHPTRGTMFAVRGGYVFELDEDVSVVQSSRIIPISFSDSSIAYDAVTGKLFVAVWNDPGNSSTQSARMRLYKIEPSTLAIEATINPDDWTARSLLNPYCGIHRIICRSGVIYGLLYAQFNDASAQYNPFSYNTTSGIGLVEEDWNLKAGFNEVEINAAELWLASADGFVAIYDTTTMLTTGTVNLAGASVWGITVNPNTGRAYLATRTSALKRVAQNHTVLANVVLPGSAPNPFCVRYNSNDGLIYVPCYGENTVVIIDPATDTVTATKTGFDSPFDVVFTPTKAFAVQHGIIGLKEIA